MTGNKPSILILTHCFPSDPADIPGNFLIDLSKHLTSAGAEVKVITQKMNRKYDEKFLSESGASIEYFCWRGGNERFAKLKFSSFKDILSVLSLIRNGRKAYRNALKQKNYDFVLSCWVIPAGLWSLSFSKKENSAVWALGSDISVYAKKTFFRQVLKFILSRTGSIFSNSINHQSEIKNLMNYQAELLYTGRTLPKSEKIYERSDKLRLLFIGRLEKIKGPDLLISALKTSGIEDFELNIIGDGSLKKELEVEVVKNDFIKKINFLGEKNAAEISGHLSASDYLVISSRSESMPVVFWEAMQAGTPVISTNVGDIGFYCQKFNVGRICEPGEKELADLLVFINNLRPLRDSLAINTSKVTELGSIAGSAEKIYRLAEGFSGQKS
ncbi:MAG: hypothetical protein A2Y39_05475 [Candidatus Delongbacteria bacterium GWF2_40_14]|nr:MAG: hypothetical protein A2Y39_05475 [Candidatus Delongbacteria bacterium GWF2_40_14]